MSVYAVTTDNRLLRYDAPNQHEWIRDTGNHWKIYYKNCECGSCNDDSHHSLIAYLEKNRIVSIGFRKPAAIEGRMLTYQERSDLKRIAECIQKRKGVPRKLNAQSLLSIAKLTE